MEVHGNPRALYLLATIIKTKTGAWKAIIRQHGQPLKTKTCQLKRDAEDWARDAESDIQKGIYNPGARILRKLLMSEALDRYESNVSPTKRASTQDRESVRFRHLHKYFGQYALTAITPEIVARYRDARLTQGKSANTVRLELALLGHLYTTAIREWGMSFMRNPVTLIKKPSPGHGRTRRLSADEEVRLLTACHAHSNPMLTWIVEVALYTGMRQGEILGLHTEQVDIERRIIGLTHTKNGTERTVPLSVRATTVLATALANPARPRDTNLVFFGDPGHDGVRRPYVTGKVWQTILTRAGIIDLHFHDLRHEAASRLVEMGLSDLEVAAITGHKSMQMLKRYTHLRAEDLVGKLDRVLHQRNNDNTTTKRAPALGMRDGTSKSPSRPRSRRNS